MGNACCHSGIESPSSSCYVHCVLPGSCVAGTTATPLRRRKVHPDTRQVEAQDGDDNRRQEDILDIGVVSAHCARTHSPQSATSDNYNLSTARSSPTWSDKGDYAHSHAHLLSDLHKDLHTSTTAHDILTSIQSADTHDAHDVPKLYASSRPSLAVKLCRGTSDAAGAASAPHYLPIDSSIAPLAILSADTCKSPSTRWCSVVTVSQDELRSQRHPSVRFVDIQPAAAARPLCGVLENQGKNASRAVVVRQGHHASNDVQMRATHTVCCTALLPQPQAAAQAPAIRSNVYATQLDSGQYVLAGRPTMMNDGMVSAQNEPCTRSSTAAITCTKCPNGECSTPEDEVNESTSWQSSLYRKPYYVHEPPHEMADVERFEQLSEKCKPTEMARHARPISSSSIRLRPPSTGRTASGLEAHHGSSATSIGGSPLWLARVVSRTRWHDDKLLSFSVLEPGARSEELGDDEADEDAQFERVQLIVDRMSCAFDR